MKASATLRRPELAGIVQWSIGFVMLGLLTVALLSLPFQLYAVRTGSMEPAFGSGDLVLVHKGEWQQGQPITFTHNGELITHRLVSVNPDGTFVTKGDANKTPRPVGRPATRHHRGSRRVRTASGLLAGLPQIDHRSGFGHLRTGGHARPLVDRREFEDKPDDVDLPVSETTTIGALSQV